MPDAFAMLKDDHRKVERLFSEYEQSQSPDVALQICDELTVHALLEEELIYPLVGAKIATGLANEARHEHQEAKQLISQIEAGLTSGTDVSDLVRQLNQSVQHHVQEEENEMFPKMLEAIPVLVEHLGEEMENRKVEFQAQLAEARSLGESAVVVDRKTGTTI